MSIGDKIILNFSWKGPNIWHGGLSQGGLDVTVVDLLFKGAKTDISVHLPENISPTSAKKFPFTCRRYHEKECELGGRKFKPLDKETHPDTLKVTVEQIRGLTIKAGFFERGRPIGPKIMDLHTGKITQQETVRRSDREVKLALPEALEPDQTYLLEITSDDLSLSARLVKASPASSSGDAQVALDHAELFQLLGGVLLPLMGIKGMEFAIRLASAPSGNLVSITPSIDGSTLGIEAIQNEIGKIENAKLKEVAEKIRLIKVGFGRKSPSERAVLDKMICKDCFDAIGSNGLINIMRSSLEVRIEGSIAPDIRSIIDEISVSFKDICLKHVV